MKLKFYLAIIYSVIISGFLALSFHIIFINKTTSIINALLNNVTIIKLPYPLYINLIAYITTFIPVLAAAILYIIMFPFLKLKSYLSQSFILGTFVLMIKGELIRQPLMNVLVGNPFLVALIQQSQIWLSNYIMSFIIVFLMKKPISHFRNVEFYSVREPTKSGFY